MDKFLESYKLSRLNQEALWNLNRHIMSKEIDLVIKIFPSKRNAGSDGFTVEFYQRSKELILIFLKLFLKIEEQEEHPNSFEKGSTMLIPKPNKDKRSTGQNHWWTQKRQMVSDLTMVQLFIFRLYGGVKETNIYSVETIFQISKFDLYRYWYGLQCSIMMLGNLVSHSWQSCDHESKQLTLYSVLCCYDVQYIRYINAFFT